MSVRLGELLTKASLITQDQLKEALKMQKETGGKLGETLIKLGFVSEAEFDRIVDPSKMVKPYVATAA